jgi:hypothetical protein
MESAAFRGIIEATSSPMITKCLLNSSSFNEFRTLAQKRLLWPALRVLDRLSLRGDHLVLPSPGPGRRRRPGHMILSQI